MTDDVTFLDPAGEIEDITPGEQAPSDLYHTPDQGYNYDEAAETWVGDPARVELRVEPVGEGEPKRFLLAEPDTPETMDAMVMAVLEGDERTFCTHAVEEPALSTTMWNERLTERERKLLYDHAFGWLGFGDFLTAQQATAEV